MLIKLLISLFLTWVGQPIVSAGAAFVVLVLRNPSASTPDSVSRARPEQLEYG